MKYPGDGRMEAKSGGIEMSRETDVGRSVVDPLS